MKSSQRETQEDLKRYYLISYLIWTEDEWINVIFREITRTFLKKIFYCRHVFEGSHYHHIPQHEIKIKTQRWRNSNIYIT